MPLSNPDETNFVIFFVTYIYIFVLETDNAGCSPAAMSNTGSPNCTCDPGYEFDNGTCSGEIS